jgi:NADH:ubiquinone oxidoreductase subunit 5 (subunit L)/multisubunit Na+/H+ antiporter MnhA subunit
MGKMVISANGDEYRKSSPGSWVIMVVIAVALVALGFILAAQFGYRNVAGGDLWGLTTRQMRTGLWHVSVWGGILSAVGVVIYALGLWHSYGKMEIRVYENRVRGAGGGPKFGSSFEDSYQISSFDLTYDQISSVDVTAKDHLVINAHGRVYLIALTNAQAVANAINVRIHQAKAPAQSKKSFCPHCGHEMPQSGSFCTNCGKAAEI